MPALMKYPLLATCFQETSKTKSNLPSSFRHLGICGYTWQIFNSGLILNFDKPNTEKRASNVSSKKRKNEGRWSR